MSESIAEKAATRFFDEYPAINEYGSYRELVQGIQRAIEEADIWRKAVDEALIVNCIGTTDNCVTVEDAQRKLAMLIKWEIDTSTDPAVNGGYRLVKEADDEKG